MKVAFRVDASLQIGSGHVMRCLNLAEGLTALGVQCFFISRDLDGNLHALTRQRGFELMVLRNEIAQKADVVGVRTSHESWLGCSWLQDAEQTDTLIGGYKVDWLVVDHYALDARWEATIRSACRHLMVIDDLADRNHCCDLLLDQNLGRSANDYVLRIPDETRVLAGTQYALLGPQFLEWRDYSLKRRSSRFVRNILVTMGGADPQNATQQVLSALSECALPQDCKMTVVMGFQAPKLNQLREFAARTPFDAEVLVNISDMARRMADSDLAIGAAGSTAWERCCLGLPSLMLVLAENQRFAAEQLERAGAAHCLSLGVHLQSQMSNFMESIAGNAGPLQVMSAKASQLVDGKGVDRVVSHMLKLG